MTDSGSQPPSRVNLPDGWQGEYPKWAGSRMRGIRRFGLPRVLDADESVWLVFRGWGKFRASLNGLALVGGLSEFDVTRCLTPRNDLTIDFEPLSTAPETFLEVRGPEFLSEVRFQESPAGWAGRVVGERREDLQIHLTARGRCVSRLEVRASPAGESFFVPMPDSLPEGWYNPTFPEWRLELIENANRWWSEDVVAATGPGFD
ncbi:MAG: hypothetical protein K1X57_02350 [Gemmataceae bacterium]|nr:hypothetical protein [Gemmataceae bacterium]